MPFDDETLERIWSKARSIPNKDPNFMRQDACSTPMMKNDYGNRNSKYGWEIDHKDPKGSNNLSNLQPLQWENNVSKSDGELKCKCKKDM